MAEIIPAILGTDFREIEQKIHQLGGLVDWVQLDVSDGNFSKPATWREPELLNEIDGRIKIEVHLMVETPEAELPDWLNVADRVIVHVEATRQLDQILTTIAGTAVRAGVALLFSTPLEIVKPFAQRFEVLQLMSIAEIGRQGAVFEEAVIGKITAWRAEYPDAKIAVDGGINLTNASRLLRAGADHLVIGSAIWQSRDPLAAIKQFRALVQNESLRRPNKIS